MKLTKRKYQNETLKLECNGIKIQILGNKKFTIFGLLKFIIKNI